MNRERWTRQHRGDGEFTNIGGFANFLAENIFSHPAEYHSARQQYEKLRYQPEAAPHFKSPEIKHWQVPLAVVETLPAIMRRRTA